MSGNQLALAISRTRDDDTLHAHQDDDDGDDDESSPVIREIHALTPPPAPASRAGLRETWETDSHRSSATSMASSEINFTSISREFNALVLAGSNIASENETGNLGRIGEDENLLEETNPLAIVPDTNPPLQSPGGGGDRVLAVSAAAGDGDHRISGGAVSVSVQSVKKEEVLSKISAWQNAKIAKINNRFKREDAVINGWEGEQVQKATSWMKKEERKLEEKRAKCLEKMQNDIAQARRKAEERRASAEAKRGTKMARILEIANLMKAVGRSPVKRSFF